MFRYSHIVAFRKKVMVGQGHVGVTSTGVSRYGSSCLV
jgi:hypothetical protein